MIRIFRTEGTSGEMLDVLRTSDPVEAEEHYLRLIQLRTDGPGVVHVNAGRTFAVPPAHYRTDSDWSAGHREQDDDRRLIQWEQGPPLAPMVRALGRVAGVSGSQAARLVGKPDGGRTWRKWVGGEKRMQISHYWWLLVATGLHPDYRRR